MSDSLPDAGRARLDEAYRTTCYRVQAPAGAIDLRIGIASAALDALLGELGAAGWAIVTAWNPHSVPQGTAANEAAQARLASELAAQGYRCLPGCNLAGDGNWPPEPSLFIAAMTPAAAARIAAAYGQNAVVVGERYGAPQLLWCRE